MQWLRLYVSTTVGTGSILSQATKIPHTYCVPSLQACSFAQLCLTFAAQWTVAHQAPLPMGFPRQQYWTGLPFSHPGDFPHPGINSAFPASPAQAHGFFTTEPARKPMLCGTSKKKKKDKANQNFTQLIFSVLFLLYVLFIHGIILYSIKVLIYLMLLQNCNISLDSSFHTYL